MADASMSARMTPTRIKLRKREIRRAARAVGWRPCPETADGYHRYGREPGGIVCCAACGIVAAPWQAGHAPDLYPASRDPAAERKDTPAP